MLPSRTSEAAETVIMTQFLMCFSGIFRYIYKYSIFSYFNAYGTTVFAFLLNIICWRTLHICTDAYTLIGFFFNTYYSLLHLHSIFVMDVALII